MSAALAGFRHITPVDEVMAVLELFDTRYLDFGVLHQDSLRHERIAGAA